MSDTKESLLTEVERLTAQVVAYEDQDEDYQNRIAGLVDQMRASDEITYDRGRDLDAVRCLLKAGHVDAALKLLGE